VSINSRRLGHRQLDCLARLEWYAKTIVSRAFAVRLRRVIGLCPIAPPVFIKNGPRLSV